VLSHRDYHGHNLFLQTANDRLRLRVIDFQDALMAPAAQDLAVLLTTRDTVRIITPTIEKRMLEFYFTAQIRRGTPMALTLDEFMESYRLCVLQHALKVVGRFIWLRAQRQARVYRLYPIRHRSGATRTRQPQRLHQPEIGSRRVVSIAPLFMTLIAATSIYWALR